MTSPRSFDAAAAKDMGEAGTLQPAEGGQQRQRANRLATDKDADGERQDYHPLLQRRKAA